MTGEAPALSTNLSTVTWSRDGTRVTKRYELHADRERFGPRATILDHHYRSPRPWVRHFSYELRVNQLVSRHRPPLRTPRLVGHDRRRLALEFEAVSGHRLGPKFPLELTDASLEELIGMATALPAYPHRPRWLRRLPIRSRLRRAHQLGLLTGPEHQHVEDLAGRSAIRWVFAHADINPSNVVTGDGGTYLLDWEWAGLYPEGYDLAFLWFVLIDMPDARAAVEAHIPGDATVFWLCALVIELLHLEWFSDQFRPRHQATRDLLVERLVSGRRDHNTVR